MDSKQLQDQYISELSMKEKKGYEIAKRLLGTTFQIDKSLGYNKWVSNNKIVPTTSGPVREQALLHSG